MKSGTIFWFCVLASVWLLYGPTALGQPVIVEPGWTLIRSIGFDNPMAARLNPLDERLYLGRRGTSTDGLYRVDEYGFTVRLAGGSNVAAVAVQPDSGHVFFSEDYGGVVYRTRFGDSGRETWVSGFRSGYDDDPVGMAFAPTGYAGDVLAPGEALVVDRGNNGYDDVWWWTPLAPEGEYQVHPDDGTLVDPVDLTIDHAQVYIADSGLSNAGAIYILHADSTLTPLSTSEALADPIGIVTDPSTDDLLVLDNGAQRLVRVDPVTGQVSDVFTDFVGAMWAGVDVTADGRRIIVTDHAADEVHIFAQCDASGQAEVDCDGNDVYDICDIAFGTHPDCNHNGVPDACDIADGTSDDCNEDGIPDDCPICPPIEVVFVMDTSTSMDDEAAALCGSMQLVVDYLLAAGVDLSATLLGICDNPGGAYDCLEGNIVDLYGSAVPGSPPPGLETLGDCPGGNEVCQEDWGLGTAVVAGAFPWLPDSTSIRLVIPLSDEGSWCGDPVTQLDQDAITYATVVALANDVIVSPITGSGSSSGVIALAEQIAAATGGTHFNSTEAAADIAYAIVALVLEACAAYTDCNHNGVLDECDIADGTSLDENLNGIPDECELVAVGDPEQAPNAVRLYQNFPNPFNPQTTITFTVDRRRPVEIAVYDVTGKQIAVLVDRIYEAGTHTTVWHGRDARGRAVPSGTYVVRMSIEGLTQARKVTLLR